MSKRRGMVKWFNSNKHFGTILDEYNCEFFVHQNDCNFCPVEGIQVEFEIGKDRKGRTKAICVTTIVGVGESNGTKSA